MSHSGTTAHILEDVSLTTQGRVLPAGRILQEDNVVRRALASPSRPWVSSVDLPGRGTTAVWQCVGPPDAATLVLLHGVTMTAELCWFRVLERLGRQFRIVAPDLRGHGDGIPLRGSRFRLEDSVDDIAALADVLDIKRFAAVGYSMGGMVAVTAVAQASSVGVRARSLRHLSQRPGLMAGETHIALPADDDNGTVPNAVCAGCHR